MNLHLKDLVNAVVESDDPPAPTPHQEPAPPQINATAVPYVPSQTTTDTVADHQDDAYQRLLTKTDFTTAPIFQTIKKYLSPISGLPLDDKTKFKIAISQAQAQDGIQADAVLAVFDQYKIALQQASDAFAQTVAKATAEQVEGKKNKAADLAAQITALQAQVTQLTEDSFAAQQKIQAAQHRFDTALQTRQSELDQERAKYASLLA